jgi:hypothetical protein
MGPSPSSQLEDVAGVGVAGGGNAASFDEQQPQEVEDEDEEEQRCRAVIERIRREEFGIGLIEPKNPSPQAAGSGTAGLPDGHPGGVAHGAPPTAAVVVAGGAGAPEADATRRLLAAQNARMGRALARLSHELYSRDGHFVLELVQVRGFPGRGQKRRQACEAAGRTKGCCPLCQSDCLNC